MNDIVEPPPRSLPASEMDAARLVVDTWQFRHGLCWRSLQRFYLAAVTVAVIPFILDCQQRLELQRWLLLFPLLGGSLALAAVWHFGAEYFRLVPLNRAVTGLLARTGLVALIPSKDLKGRAKVLYRVFCQPHIGWVTVIVLTTVTAVLAVIDFTVVAQSLPITSCPASGPTAAN